MLNGNMTGQYNPGSILPQSQETPPRTGGRPSDYDALKAEFDRLASEVGAGAPTAPAAPAQGFVEPQQAMAPSGPVAPSEGTPAREKNQTSKVLRGALRGAANAANDDEAIAMLQAILTR